MATQAGPRDQEPVRARPEAVRRGRRAAQGAAAAGRQYWASYADAQKALENGSTEVGSTWQIIINLAKGDKAPVESVLPKEGATGWADTWMVDAKSPHPNCAYHVDELGDQARRPGADRGVVRRGPGQRQGLRAHHRQDALRHLPRAATRTTSRRSGSGRRRSPTASTGVRTSSASRTRSGARRGAASRTADPTRMTTTVERPASTSRVDAGSRPPSSVGRACASSGCSRCRRPGSSSSTSRRCWRCWPPRSSRSTSSPTRSSATSRCRTSRTSSPTPPTGTRPIRTVGIAAAVTVLCTLLGFPMAFFMAKVALAALAGAARRARRHPAVGVLPREDLRLAGDGPARHRRPRVDAQAVRAGPAPASASAATILTLTYLWLPYMILPVYAGLDRMPDSLSTRRATSVPTRRARCAAWSSRSSTRRSSRARSSRSR